MSEKKFLPICREDMEERGWETVDFAIVTADAYIDHHSFGTAIIARVLENAGYKVGIIAQPDWKSLDDFMKLGKPRLGFLVNGGNMDPMVNHYTVSKRLREKDMYSPGGKMGMRPDRATIVYCNKIREAYKDIDIVIGGIEASLRRFAHYDYWSNSVRKSILVDSGADLLLYGMGERHIVQVAQAMNDGLRAKYISYIEGTCYLADDISYIENAVEVPSFKEVSEDKMAYAKAFNTQYFEQNPKTGKVLIQKHGNKYLVQNKPDMPLSREELDEVYGLPYMKTYHPIYEKDGGISAIQEVQFSIASSRGCFGSCSFCALTFHEGRIVQSRSQESIIKEAEEMTELPNFKGYIHDVGGPTANFRGPACNKQEKGFSCKHKQCLTPKPCSNLKVDHSDYVSLLRKLRKLPKVKKVFVRSGIRYDYVMADKDDTFFRELVEHHVSGQLKVAPEHVSAKVLKYMGKPSGKTYDQFREKFFKLNKEVGKEQYLIPYLMSSHPGSTLETAIELAEYLRDIKYQPEQVQDFYPTPGTLSTTMFYTGIDPLTMEEVYVPKSKEEKAMQRALLQFSNPKKYEIVHDALMKAGREDLIGNGPKCLIRSKEDRYREKMGIRGGNGGNKPSQGKSSKPGTRGSVATKSGTKGSVATNKGKSYGKPSKGQGSFGHQGGASSQEKNTGKPVGKGTRKGAKNLKSNKGKSKGYR